MSRTLPNIGLAGGYAEGEDDWTDSMNANLLKLSVLVQGGVLDQVAAVPAAPNEGDIYILTADPNSKAVAAFSNGAWTYYPPIEGWLLYDKTKDAYVQYDGAAWKVLATGGGGGGGIPEAPDDGKLYGRQSKAWAEIVATGGGGGASSVVGAHKYWAIQDLQAATGNVQLQSLAFYDGNTRRLPSSFTASSRYDSTYDANNMLTDDGTYWAALGLNGWLYAQFDAAVFVSRIIATPVAAAPEQAPRQLNIAYSDDGTNWTVIAMGLVPSWTANQPVTFKVPTSVAGGGGSGLSVPKARRYWRMAFLRTSSDAAAIQELTFYDLDGNVLPISAITTRSTYPGGYNASNMFDANKDNFWTNDGSAMREWVQVDMGASVPIARMTMRARNDGSGASQIITDFVLLAGDNPASLELMGAMSVGNSALNQGAVYSFNVQPNGNLASAGGGSGNGGFVRPKIIQRATWRGKGGGIAKFANPVTPGNILVFIANSYAGGAAPDDVTRWARILEQGTDTDAPLQTAKFQKAQVFMRVVPAGGLGTDLVVNCGDVGNVLVLELDKVDGIFANAARMNVDGNTGETWVAAPKMPGDCIRVAFIEHDVTNPVNFTAAALKGQKIDFNGTYNHAGQAYILASDDPVMLQAFIENPTYAQYLAVQVGKLA